jgi:hypothetical protein
MKGRLSAENILAMVRHWLNSPVGIYLGSNYGHDDGVLLQLPYSPDAATEFLAKLVADIPILKSVAISVQSEQLYPDSARIFLNVAGMEVDVVRAD